MKNKFDYLIYKKVFKYIKKFFRLVSDEFSFNPIQEGKKDLEYFKSKAFYTLSIFFIVFAFLPISYGVFLLFKEALIIPGIVEFLIYLIVLILMMNNRINIIYKRYIFVLCVYLMGLMLLFVTGPKGAGLVVIVSAFGLAAFLMKKRHNIVFILISLLVFIGISILLHNGLLKNMLISQYKQTWFIVAISTQTMGTLFVLIINNLFSNIEHQIEEIEKRTNIIKESEEKYKLLFENSGVLVGYYSPKGKIISYNKKEAESMGGLPKDFIDKSIYDILPESYADKCMNQITNAILDNTSKEYEDLVPFITGEKWLSSTFNKIVNIKGDVVGVQIVSIDITAKKQVQEKLIHASIHDEFTGLYNRKYFEEAKSTIDNQDVVTYAIIIADVNGLNLINDAFGFAEGDHLLIETVKILQSCCCNKELLARTGGDDFSIFMPAVENEVKNLIQQIKDRCQAYNQIVENKELCISLSIGYGLTNGNKGLDEAQKEAINSLNNHKILEGKSHQNSIISSMIASMYEKSQETKDHADRIAFYSQMLGEKIGLSQNDMDQLYLFSMLHDIGKIGIDDSILNKPGTLTNEEWEEMKKHPEIGYRIAMSTIELKSSAKFILTHHERWDGKGYPQGLLGEKIPILSRILAIADAYDAMTEDRVYRKAITSEKALAEINENSGTQFDPQLAKLFIEIISKTIVDNNL